jgi:hypothetical protein
MKQKDIYRIQNLFLLFIILVVIASFFFSPEAFDWIGDWFLNLVIVSAALSITVGTMVEAFSGDTLKRISFNIKVWRVSFSVTAFFIAVFILKFVLL